MSIEYMHMQCKQRSVIRIKIQYSISSCIEICVWYAGCVTNNRANFVCVVPNVKEFHLLTAGFFCCCPICAGGPDWLGAKGIRAD